MNAEFEEVLVKAYLNRFNCNTLSKNRDDRLIFIHLGEAISKIENNDAGTSKQPEIVIRNTSLDVTSIHYKCYLTS